MRKIGFTNEHGVIADAVLYGVLAVFVLVLVVLVAVAFVRPDAPQFAPSPVQPETPASVVVSDTITIDGRDGDRWQFFDFDVQSVVMAPDTAGWDLAFRRFNILVRGGALDLDRSDFVAIDTVPASAYTTTTIARDTTNAAIDRWYDYGMLTHMLEPKDNVYAIRTQDGTYAKLQFLSYYCPGLQAGCVTFRYVYRSDGSHRLR